MPSGHSSVCSAFLAASEEHAARPFLHAPASATAAYADTAISWSYADVFARVTQLAAAYQARDLQTGQRVALAFDSRLDVYVHLLAANSVGASIVPLNSSATDPELRYLIEHSDCRLISAADEHRERLAGISGGLCIVGNADLTATESPELRPAGGPTTEAALLYTSGTTGKPKGCMLSNEYFLAVGEWYTGLGGICSLDSSDRMLTPLPPNHMNALCTSFVAMMMCGGCLVQLDRFHPRSWWQTVREERASVIHCLGVMTAMLLTLPESDDDDFSRQIKFCFGPGSDPRHQAAFESRFGFPLVEAWAMTETGAGAITIADREPRHVGERCIGKPLESMDYRIVDERDMDVADGQDGELLVRSKGDDPRAKFFSGYYKDEAATEEGWRGGWWHTGDVVREGPDGSLFFVDRRKNVIRRSGENIAAVEVEAVLYESPDVEACAVCPVPDEIRGDEVFAFVVLAEGSSTDAQSLFDFCMTKLTYFKVPGYIAFVDALPLTASQKVSRGKLKPLARESIATGNCVDLREFKRRPKS
ncbi:MAG: AMP-binding protein [Gammaproteobacteria bacterium]|nr:AMP-binding protein [Gammaproteobacteria bacterium]